MKRRWAAALMLAAFASRADTGMEHRTGFIECGSAQIRARSECVEHERGCVTETLSFSRRAGRVIVPLHAGHTERAVGDRKVKLLDYRARLWACVPGKSGGHYLVVAMVRAEPGCADCEYSRLYDLNGRLIATDFTFDAAGRQRAHAAGRELMHQVLGGPGRHPFREVYR